MTNSSKLFLILLIALIGGGFYAFNEWNAGANPPVQLADGPVNLTIPEGTGARDVAQILEDNGVILSAGAFTAFAAADGRANQIQAGTYDLIPGSSNEELLVVLTEGPSGAETYTVTIPEGLSVSETLTRIAEAEGSRLTVEELRAGLGLVALPEWIPADRELPEGGEAFEGLLFPETYQFTVDQPAEEVLTRLVQQTDTVLTRVGAATRNELSLYQTLVIASLVEDEARLPDERAVISSVIHNRISDGMALQIDATVVYGIVAAGLERPDRLVNEDYNFQSPWSTYTNVGLPPTPLSGAGEASIVAAAQPSETAFYFYVVENPETGAHRFSETLDQHNAAIAEIRGS